jgi:peptide-methionine (S)-S-oxide reductase
VTKVVQLDGFYPAEEYHQDFAARYPDHPYIVIHDAPKVAQLKAAYPQLYRGSRP